MKYKLFKYYSNVLKNCCMLSHVAILKTSLLIILFLYFKTYDNHNIYGNYSEDFYFVFSFTCSFKFFYALSYLLYQYSYWTAQKFCPIQKDPTQGERSNPFCWTGIAVQRVWHSLLHVCKLAISLKSECVFHYVWKKLKNNIETHKYISVASLNFCWIHIMVYVVSCKTEISEGC